MSGSSIGPHALGKLILHIISKC